MNEMRKELKDTVAILLGVEILDYHNKNFLSLNRKEINEMKQELLIGMARILEKCKLDEGE